MGKLAPDAFLDAALDYAAGADYLCVCADTPTDYTGAYTTYMLAKVAVDSGDFTKADDTSGRKVTIGAQSGLTIDNTGTATHIALVKTGDTTLRYVTTCTSQALGAGGTVDVPAWKITISDPA